MATDLTGKKYGKWNVMHKAEHNEERKSRSQYWHCKCDCGTEKDVDAYSLIRGSSTSCGCNRREKAEESWQRFVKRSRFYDDTYKEVDDYFYSCDDVYGMMGLHKNSLKSIRGSFV